MREFAEERDLEGFLVCLFLASFIRVLVLVLFLREGPLAQKQHLGNLVCLGDDEER